MVSTAVLRVVVPRRRLRPIVRMAVSRMSQRDLSVTRLARNWTQHGRSHRTPNGDEQCQQ